VHWRVLEWILALDIPRATNLEEELETLDARATQVEGRISGHGSKIRQLEARVERLERILHVIADGLGIEPPVE
jgi:hypothetical protein